MSEKVTITAQVKKWGNSWGIILPKDAATKLAVREGTFLSLDINPVSPLRNLFLHGPRGHDLSKALREVRKDNDFRDFSKQLK